MSTSTSNNMAAKKLSTNIRSDTSSNSSRTTRSRIYVGDYFPIRLRNCIISNDAWLQSYRAEQLRRYNTLLNTKIKSNEEIQEELKRYLQRKPKESWPKSSFLLDATYILKYCKITDPEEVFSLKINNRGLNLANTEDFHLFTNLELIDAEDNLLKFEVFSSFNRLSQLKLPLNKITDLTMKFGEFPHLQYLDLSYNELTGECFQYLGFMPNLRYLNLGNNNISYLPKDSTKCFSLVDSTEVRYIRFPRLEVLKLDNNKLESPDIFIPLANIIHLIYLDLEGNNIYHIPSLDEESEETTLIPQPVKFPAVYSTMQDTPPSDLKEKQTPDDKVNEDDENKAEKNLEKQEVTDKDVKYQKPSDQTDKTVEDENLKCQDLSKEIHDKEIHDKEIHDKEIHDKENQHLEELPGKMEDLHLSQEDSLNSRERLLASKVALPGSREISYISGEVSQSSREDLPSYMGEAFGSVEQLFSSTEGMYGDIEGIFDSMDELPGIKEEILSKRKETFSSKERLLEIIKESSSYDKDLQNQERECLRTSRRGSFGSRKESQGSNSKVEIFSSVIGISEEELSSSREGSHICTEEAHESANDYCSGCFAEELAARTSLTDVLHDFDSLDSPESCHLANEMILMEEIPSIEDLNLFMNLSKIKETLDVTDNEENPPGPCEQPKIEEEIIKEEVLVSPSSSSADSAIEKLQPPEFESESDNEALPSEEYSLESIEVQSEKSEVSIAEMKSKTCDCYSTRPVKEDKEEKTPFPQLAILNLSHNKVFCQEALMAVSDWPMIQQLFLFNNPIMENTRGKELSTMAATLCNTLGVDVFCKPNQEQNEHHLEIQKNDARTVKTFIRKVPKVPVEQLMAIEHFPDSVETSWDQLYNSCCSKSIEEGTKSFLVETTSSSVCKEDSVHVTVDNTTKSPHSDKTMPQNVDAQQKSTPFFVTQPKEDEGESTGMKQSEHAKEHEDPKEKMTKEDLLTKKASQDLNYSANDSSKVKYKGYEVLFDDSSVKAKKSSSIEKLANISALRQALKTDIPFKRRIPKNFTKDLVIKSKEAVSKTGISFDERIDNVLTNIREQTVWHEVNLADIFSDPNLYKEEYKEARKLIKQIENYYANSYFNKRRQKSLQTKNKSQS